MKTYFLMAVIAFLSPLAFVGCDKQVAEDTKTTTGADGTKTETKSVTQSPNGTVTEKTSQSSSTTTPAPNP